jgi:hypothetical protein
MTATLRASPRAGITPADESAQPACVPAMRATS